MRDYGLEPLIWDAKQVPIEIPAFGSLPTETKMVDCEHEWGNKSKKSINLQAGNPEFQREWREQATNKDSSQGQFCALCGAWRGSLGLEPTIQLYIQHLKQIFAEVYRVLKPAGTVWVNIGDSYASGKGTCFNPGGNENSFGINRKEHNIYPLDRGNKSALDRMGLKQKSLCLIPDRFRLMMVDELGFILRNEIIWYKRNCMPSSAKDRFTVDWESVNFFVKNKKYWFEQQMVPVQECSVKRLQRAVSNQHKWVNGPDGQTKHTMILPRPHRSTKIPKEQSEMYGNPRARYHREYKGGGNKGRENNYAISTHAFEDADYLVTPFDPEKGRNKRCVWDIPTKSYSESHFAVFPLALVETPILAGCPEGGIVLDIFAGSCTVAEVAIRTNRNWIMIEPNPDYVKIGKKRLKLLLAQTDMFQEKGRYK